MQQAILNVITTRRSVRNFDDAPVTEEQIRTILRAGMFAPSAHNTRAWQFVTVSDKAMLRQLAGLHRFWKPLAG
ncbi:MAG: nitroreductase family protein, partial [Clostridiales bacterium]|nr:nitroreductase family protein [Clostridiales bacterium]